MGKLNIGWSEVILVDEHYKKISLAGQFAERISEYVEKPLTATAMAVEAGGEQMILLSADLVNVGYTVVEAVRERLKNNPLGIDVEKIIMCAIHTHTGPEYPSGQRSGKIATNSGSNRDLLISMLPEGRKYIPAAPVQNNPEVATSRENFDMIVEKFCEAILNAWQNRKPGSFVNAFGRAAVGMCRRITFNDGSAQMWGDSNTACFDAVEGGSDTGIELLYVFDENGRLTGIVPNLACPAQCVQHRLFVSPDFWGEAKMLLRKHFGEGLYMLPLCSAAGDQCPVDLVRWVEPYTDVHDPNCYHAKPWKRKADPSMFDLDGMRKAGKRVANEIIEVFNEGLDEPQSDVEFVHHVHWMQLPLRRVTLTDVAVAKKAIRDYLVDHPGDVDYNDVAHLQIYLGTLKRYELQEVMETLDTEVHVLRLGTVAIATNPFELFLDYGNQIKARSRSEQTFLIQLANGTEGYLPTEKAERGGHYSAFVSSGQIGHIGGEQLVRETLKDINSLF